MRGVVYLMATSLLVFVMISSNPPSCQASCIGRWCGRPEPCYPARSKEYCTDSLCFHVCAMHELGTKNSYCKKPKKGRDDWMCCCPIPRPLV
ncbi:unnamed protein product [Urochloa decumbens]|uniref:Uncharacterized protein n=1 Tax=Urochloa decumbens TaxID=240449 RepID=A0ABC9B221_9POAL